MKNILIIVGICLLVLIGAWLLVPIFRDVRIDERDVESMRSEKEILPQAHSDTVLNNSVTLNTIASGKFVSVAHVGEGMAFFKLLGTDQIVRLQDLAISNGPDLRVVLSKNADVTSSSDLGEYVDIGPLKGNQGNQNYTVPKEINLNDYHSVVIYCRAFRVVFNVATLNSSLNTVQK